MEHFFSNPRPHYTQIKHNARNNRRTKPKRKN